MTATAFCNCELPVPHPPQPTKPPGFFDQGHPTLSYLCVKACGRTTRMANGAIRMTKVLQILTSRDLQGTATLQRLNLRGWHEQCSIGLLCLI